ncbi:MAG TPA: DUF6178 family protein, partial [Kofleriaceae bacterium]|nr:DUF6178 family protein [Kofleriaceae bacterium]
MDREHTPGRSLERLREVLAGPRGYRKIDALLSQDDAAAAVAALSPGEVFELVHQVGFEDAIDLIHLATPEQIRGCLDIDAWDGDHVLTDAMKPWLSAVAGAGFEKLGATWERLDPELRALWVQRNTFVYDLSIGEEIPEDEERPLYPTVDGFFMLALLGDDDTQRITHEIIDDLYRADADLARHTIMAARSEPSAELEEMSYRWRKGRMADLGYVDFFEALDIFQPLEPDKVQIGEGTHERFVIEDGARSLPVAIAEQVVTRSFFARAYARLEASEAERVEQALIVLVNRVLAAARVKPGDQVATARASEYAMATTSLGLETIARGDTARAEQALRTVALTRLFRAGYTALRKLRKLADGLSVRAATAGSPAVEVVGALRAPWPMLARAIDTPPPRVNEPFGAAAPAAPEAGARPFESVADLRRAAEMLTRLAVRVTLVEGLGVDLIAMSTMPEPRAALDDHARTAIVRAAIGGELSAAALEQAELEKFRALCERGPDGVVRIDEPSRLRAQAQVASLLAKAGLPAREVAASLVDAWLVELADMLGAIDGVVDPRFVEGV